jgi:hypothetical protein
MKNDRQVISVRQTLIIALAGIICPSQQHDLSTPIDWYDTSIAFVDKDEFTSTGMSIENYTNNKPSQTKSRDDVEYDITDPILQNFTQSKGVKEVDENDLVVEDEQCRLYLAESTIPNAGWGLFVGVDINENEQFSASGDGIIPFETLLSDDCLIGMIIHLPSAIDKNKMNRYTNKSVNFAHGIVFFNKYQVNIHGKKMR